MGSLTLRSRLTLLLAATMGAATLLSAIAYLANRGADNRLEAAFAEELSVMSELPEHRGRLRQIDLMTDNFLLTHDPRWLPRRQAAIAIFLDSHVRLGRLIHEPKEALAWKEILPAFRGYIAHQDMLVSQESSGALTVKEAATVAMANDEIDGLIRDISLFGKLSFQETDSRRRAARSAALATFFLVLVFCLSGSFLVSAVVSRIILTPLMRLREESSQWKLGEPWVASLADSAPELRELQDSFRAMAAKLNEQYERERESSRPTSSSYCNI